jgi:hypothetical protein
VLLVAAAAVAMVVVATLIIGGRRNSQPSSNMARAPIAPLTLPIQTPEMSVPTATIPGLPPVRFAQDVTSGPVAARRMEEINQRKAAEARSIEQRVAVLRAAQLQEQDAQIQALLVRAKSEYAAGALWQPAGANAADDYRQILQMQPQRADAVTGAQRVADILVAEAARTESVHDIYTTRLLIDRIQTLQPEQPQLADLQARLAQLLVAPGSLGARERERLEQAAQYISRANTDLGRDPLDFHAADDATAQYDKARSTAPAAPGLPSLQERLVNAYAVAVRTELSHHEPKKAEKLLSAAHRHHWSSAELEQLASTVAAGGAAPAPLKEAEAH